MPHLTLSFGRENAGESTSGNLSELCVGLACFVAWTLSAGMGMPALLDGPTSAGSGIATGLGFAMRCSFAAMALLTLLFIGCTDQRYLRFYVDKKVLALAGLFGGAGTVCAAVGAVDGMIGWVLGCGGAALMGLGGGLLFPLWGTAFARDEFTTITLNSSAGIALGTVISVALIDWAPPIVSVMLEVMLIVLSVLLLRRTTPIPYYRRRSMPIFHALRVSRVRFLLHLGIPVILFGITLGILGGMCATGAFCTGIIANDLMVGVACALCLVIFIVDVALMKDEAHWDTLFRYMLPVVGLGSIGIPLFCGAYQLGAVFLLTVGFVILLILLWVMLSDMCQEFRLSPIFVFGVGGTLLVASMAAGALLVPPVSEWETMSSVRWTGLAMGAIVLLMLAGSINPRKRDVVKMLAEKRSVVEMTQLNQMVVDDATRRGEALTDEQRAAADPLPSPQACATAVVDDRGAGSVNTPVEPAASSAAETERAAAAAAFAQNARLIMGTTVPTEGAAERVGATGVTEPLDEMSMDASEPSEPKQKGSFYRRCEEIADQYLLSRRETEVLFLLAKGHKAGFIEDKLCVSRSTAKTHINHIYKKMDIHTQQELLNMVEDRPRLSDTPSPPTLHHGF